jgi:cell division protein FtsI (penicillin-binding protein 3)
MSLQKYVDNDILPFIKAGNQEELTLVCNELGISNHSLTEEEWVRTARVGNGVNWKKNVQGQGIVPDVSGMTFRDAIYLLEKSGLTVFYEGKGRVVNQSLSAGARISKGDHIYLRLG